METNGAGPTRWLLVIRPGHDELLDVLRARLEGSGVEVLIERRTRERRRGSLGPLTDRRQSDRRRQRAVALLSAAAPVKAAEPATLADSGSDASTPALPVRAVRRGPREGPVTHACPDCASAIELELPRFPHPPARVEMRVAHVAANGRDARHYVEIAAFTVSGRLILSQRVPGRRPV